MLFSSYEFIFGFLPICLVGWALLAWLGWPRVASWWLSAASLVFYAWWNPDPGRPWSPKYLGLILASIALNYLLGDGISRAVARGVRARAKTLLTVGVAGNLAALAYFKYAGFLVGSAGVVLGQDFRLEAIALPLAISFFTFTQIAFLVDAFHERAPAPSFRSYLLFVSFFPHLIAGPIVLSRSLLPQLAKRETWRFDAENFAAGLSLFAVGLFKKVVVADRLAPIANETFGAVARGAAPGLAAAWLGAAAYALQLYFDFSGYSDMAIGLGRMFNVRFPLNFNSPYQARDISDFWRRWHMSLSQFLRDYLYIPLGGNRRGEGRRLVNLFVTMLLGGLWHGAGWTFAIWGGLHGIYLCVHHAWTRASRGVAWVESRPAVLVGWLVTQVAVVVGWVVFRAPSVADAGAMLSSMAGRHGGLRLELTAGHALVAVALAVVWFAPNTDEIFRLAERPAAAGEERAAWWRPTGRWAIAVGAIFAVAVLHLGAVKEFLYFRF